MKHLKFFLAGFMAFAAFSATAQVDLSAPEYAKWGETVEERQENILNSQFLKEAMSNRNYDEASVLLHKMLAASPGATENTFINGTNLYKNRINRAKTKQERDLYVDSLMWIYDQRLQYMGDHPQRGTVYILDRKAREYLNFRPDDRAGIRKLFREAIEAAGPDVDPETVVAYFSNLCDDYTHTDEVTPDEVISEYERLSPVFENNPDAEELKGQFDSFFALSKVADCENLEKLFAPKLAAAPDDEALLAQAVGLMAGAHCDSDFFLATAEKYYQVKPSSDTAMFLAEGFQNKGDYEKAITYLNEALAVEQAPDKRAQLLVRIALVELVSNDIQSAAAAARQARELNPEDGRSYFVLAQCYASSAANCGGFSGQAAFWAAYDTMARAIELLKDDPDYLENAKASLGAYRSRFPTAEECFFNELKAGDRYTVDCGTAAGVATTVRPR